MEIKWKGSKWLEEVALPGGSSLETTIKGNLVTSRGQKYKIFPPKGKSVKKKKSDYGGIQQCK